jgi:hypothetical protein
MTNGIKDGAQVGRPGRANDDVLVETIAKWRHQPTMRKVSRPLPKSPPHFSGT